MVASEIGKSALEIRNTMGCRELQDWGEFFLWKSGEQTESELESSIRGAFKWQTSETYSSTSVETPKDSLKPSLLRRAR